MCSDFGSYENDDEDDGATEPTAGERVVYALGQLYRLRALGRLPVDPAEFDIEDVARIVGVADQFEFATETHRGRHYHFADEVLVVRPDAPLPWRLLDSWDWALAEEIESDFEKGWD